MSTIDLWEKDYQLYVAHFAKINRKWMKFRRINFNKAQNLSSHIEKRFKRRNSFGVIGDLLNEFK